MNAVEIIMEQKKIAAEKEKAERKLAFDAMKSYVEEHLDEFYQRLLNLLIKNFSKEQATKVEFYCGYGSSGYPLGEDYPESIGISWTKIVYDGKSAPRRFGLSLNPKVEFPWDTIGGETKENEELYGLFVSHLLMHTLFPQKITEEGFVVQHTGCGCCESIIITLPED
jgi:hypothetical protein